MAVPATTSTRTAQGHARRKDTPKYTEGRVRSAVLRLLPLAVAAIPPLLIVLTILQAGTTVPMEDHWDMIPLLERDVAGTLGLRDLWAQQNEHRYVVPWVFMIGLARVTRWNIQSELFLNVAFSLAAVAALVSLVVRACRGPARVLWPWLVLVVSLVTFSQVKWENWLWGMSAPAFASALAACLTIAALAWLGPTVRGLVVALAAAIAGVLSFANGLVLLGMVPLGLLADPRAPLRTRVRLALIAAVAGAAMMALYLAGLQHPAKHPDPFLFLERPIAFVGYVLTYVGAPLGSPEVILSLAWGSVGVAVLVVGAAWLWRRVPESRVNVLPWLLLAAWVLGSGAMVGVGRLGIGLGQATSSRYTTMSTYFWVSVAVIGALAVFHALERRRDSRRIATAALAVLVLGVVAAAASYAYVWTRADRWVDSLEQAATLSRECLRAWRQAPDPCLNIMHHDPGLIRQRAVMLERLRLGPLADPPSRPSLASYTVVGMREPVGRIGGGRARLIIVRFVVGTVREYHSLEITLAGWARDPTTGRPARSVLIVADGVVLDEIPVTDDTARAGPADPPIWTYRFNAFRLTPGAKIVEAYAVLDGRRIARLDGAWPLPDPPRP
jgi:hypothetical protein